jgi:hypothetical protein
MPSSPPIAKRTPSLPARHQREHQTQRHCASHHHYHYRGLILETRSPVTSQSLLRVKPRRRSRRKNARHGRRAAGDQDQSRRSGHERDFGPARRFPSGRRQALGWYVTVGVLARPVGVKGVFWFCLLEFEDFLANAFSNEVESGSGGGRRSVVERRRRSMKTIPPIELLLRFFLSFLILSCQVSSISCVLHVLYFPLILSSSSSASGHAT